MFSKSPIETKLESEITAQLEKLGQSQDAAERGAILDHITKLQKLKTEESNAILARDNAIHNSDVAAIKLENDSRIKPPSLDTVLVVSANIFGILWLARYEKEHVIKAQKALGFVMKPR